MGQRLGEVIYWISCGLAVLVLIVGLAARYEAMGFALGWSSESIAASIIAAFIWGFGRAVLYITNGK